MREILNALPNPRATLKPTGIGIRDIVVLTVPAGLKVGLDARLCRRPQPAILLVFRVLQRPRPRRCYCEEVSFRHVLPLSTTAPALSLSSLAAGAAGAAGGNCAEVKS